MPDDDDDLLTRLTKLDHPIVWSVVIFGVVAVIDLITKFVDVLPGMGR